MTTCLLSTNQDPPCFLWQKIGNTSASPQVLYQIRQRKREGRPSETASTQPPLCLLPSLSEAGAAMAKPISIEVWNPSGKYRVVSTKSMPGTRWIRLLTDNDCRLEVLFLSVHSPLLCCNSVCLPRWQICTEQKTILSVDDILALIGDRCDGVIGQLTEDWGDVLFSALKRAGGTAFSNMAVGYNNVDVEAANRTASPSATRL